LSLKQKYSSIEEKFLASFEKLPSGCWKWIGAKSSGSHRPYGALAFMYDNLRAHRWSYEHFKGPIPKGLVIDHLCRNTLCVNPDHLEPVTTKENVLRGKSFSAINAVKTHCIHGHLLEGDNVKITPRQRTCQICKRESWRKSGEKRRKRNKTL
jgi:hypothetical protein